MKKISLICLVTALLATGSPTYAQIFSRSEIFDFGDGVGAFVLAFEDSFHGGYQYKVLADQAPSTGVVLGSGTMLILGLGMLGFAGWGRKKYHK